MRIDEGMILHSYAPLYDIPIIRSFLYGHKGMCEHYLKSASSSGDPFSEQSSSYTSRVLTRKTCIFQARTDKVPIEEMTDRWETEYSDGWQSIDSFTIRFFFRRKNPSLKETANERDIQSLL